jgi:hypothetical protein
MLTSLMHVVSTIIQHDHITVRLYAAYYSACLNSFVHAFMYSYYFLASAIGKDGQGVRKRYLWWGQYLTMFQMFQFVTMILQVRLSPPLLLPPLLASHACDSIHRVADCGHHCRVRDEQLTWLQSITWPATCSWTAFPGYCMCSPQCASILRHVRYLANM